MFLLTYRLIKIFSYHCTFFVSSKIKATNCDLKERNPDFNPFEYITPDHQACRSYLIRNFGSLTLKDLKEDLSDRSKDVAC